jgi:hypothetical protein
MTAVQVAHDVYDIGEFDWTGLGGHGDQQQKAGDCAQLAENTTSHLVRQLPPEVLAAFVSALG